tara:strand:+ start:1447 stop:2361 length:915 start_codon:yes stop_codon:yes gene_type:complete
MAAFAPTNAVTTTTGNDFIPELWSDEVIASYKANLVLGGICTGFDHQGRKGDVINIPTPTRLSANSKTEADTVTLNSHSSGNTAINIDKHFEYSVLFEDHSSALALDSIRTFHTDDAGHALSKQVDTDLVQLGRSLQSGPGTNAYPNAFIGSDGNSSFTGSNEAAVTDVGIRRSIQRLDDADVPQSQRYMIIPPVAKNSVLGLARFTEQAFVGEIGAGNSIRNGRVGNVYGMEILVSTNCDTANGGERVILIMHRSAFALAQSIAIRVQTQYMQEYLGTLLTADTLYGVAELRNDAGLCLIVPA